MSELVGFWIFVAIVAIVGLKLTGPLDWILYRLFDDVRFRGLEKLAIDAWKAKLRPEQREIVDQQLDACNLVQSGGDGLKVCCYNKWNRPMQSFPGVLELQKVATVELVDSSSIKSGVLQAKIFFFQGRIFSVEYPQRPKRFAELHGASLKKMKVAKVTVHLEI